MCGVCLYSHGHVNGHAKVHENGPAKGHGNGNSHEQGKKLIMRAEFGPLWEPWEVDEIGRKKFLNGHGI
jgi:hypothetical protein